MSTFALNLQIESKETHEQGRYIFSQLCDFLPVDFFKWLVKKYKGNKYVKSFTCWNHLLVLIFGQLSNREGLRDLTTTLAPHKRSFHHLGFGKSVTRSNLGKANEVRDVRIFKEFAERMISLAREKRAGVRDFFLDNKVYAFDSTTISLCLSVFWWCKLHHSKSGVKMHTLYDVATDVPAFVVITDACLHDSKVSEVGSRQFPSITTSIPVRSRTKGCRKFISRKLSKILVSREFT